MNSEKLALIYEHRQQLHISPDDHCPFCNIEETERKKPMGVNTYTAKPVQLEGIVWNGKNNEEVRQFTNGMSYVKYVNGELMIHIETVNGTSRGQIGWTILKGTQGEVYPVPPEVIEAKYSVTETV